MFKAIAIRMGAQPSPAHSGNFRLVTAPTTDPETVAAAAAIRAQNKKVSASVDSV